MRKSLLLALLTVVFSFYDSSCVAQAPTDLNLQVEGSAPVLKNDEARAREDAVKDALEKAILLAVTQVSPRKSGDESSRVVKNAMTGQVDRYIKHYRMISETRQHDDYTVHLSVVVALTTLRDDLTRLGVPQESSENENVSVTLSVAGVKKYSDFDRLRTFLQNRPRIVKRIYPCRLEWQQARFDLMVGSVRNLVGELEKTGSYSFLDPGKSQNVVEINLRVKEESR